MNMRTTAITAGLGLAMVATSSLAFNTSTSNGKPIKWAGNHITLQLASNITSSSARRTAVNDAIRRWAETPSNFWFSVANDDDGWALDNKESEVAYTTSSSLLGGASAITYSWWKINTGELVETDILMNAGVRYTSSTRKTTLLSYGGDDRPAQTTLIHEFGHALGLGHVNTLYNIMGRDWTHIHTNSSTSQGYAGEDACAGAVFLYGRYTANQDLGVVHWKRTGASGAYSVHSRTQILNSAGSPLTSFISANEPLYYVRKGTTIRPEVTFENNGASGHSTDVSYVLSTNAYITTWDQEIRRISNVYWSPDRPYLGTYSVTIPHSIATGYYWLGLITDADDDVNEVAEWNNATYIAKLYIY